MASLETKSFSNIITFTRASRATYFDSTGIIKSATTNTPRFDYNPITLALRGILVEEQRTNLLTYSEDFNNSAWGKTRSSIAANAATSPSGAINADKLVEDTTATNNHIAFQTPSATSSIYTFSVFAKAAERTEIALRLDCGTSGQQVGYFNLSTGITGSTTSNITSSIINCGNGWYRCTITLIASDSIINSVLMLAVSGNSVYTGNGTSGVFIWGAQLEAGAFPTSYIPSSVTFSGRTSTATYFDYTGTLRTALSGEARISYNPSNLSADPFLLLEESRTNSIRNNTMADAVAGVPGTAPTNWALQSIGLSSSIIGTGTENGITYIDVRIFGTTTSQYGAFFFDTNTGIAASPSQIWTNSVYLKLVSGSTTGLGQYGVSMHYYNSTPSLFASSTTSITLTSTITRYTVSATAPATTVSIRPAIFFNGLNASGDSVDITLRIGMPQLEQGAGATSVIPTSSVAVTRSADTSSSATATRSADVASINTLDPWYNANEGTLFVETTRGYTGNFVNYPHTSGLSDGTTTNVIWAGYAIPGSQSITPEILTGGVDQFNYVTGAYSMTTAKNAIAYKTNDSQWVFNGTAFATDTTCTIPSGLNKLSIGSDPVGGQTWNGWIERVTYYPRRLTNAELQALTT